MSLPRPSCDGFDPDTTCQGCEDAYPGEAPRDRLETRRCPCGIEFQAWTSTRDPWCVWCRDAQRKAAGAPARDKRLDEEAEHAERMAEYRRDVL